MDISFVVVLWIIVMIVQAINDRKKTPPPPEIPPQNSSGNLDFEIPTLANDPNQSEIEEINLAELYRQKKHAAQNLQANKTQAETKNFVEEETENIEVNITPESAMNAIILSEILDKPKALRQKKF